jgi:hypothetical protein
VRLQHRLVAAMPSHPSCCVGRAEAPSDRGREPIVISPGVGPDNDDLVESVSPADAKAGVRERFVGRVCDEVGGFPSLIRAAAASKLTHAEYANPTMRFASI